MVIRQATFSAAGFRSFGLAMAVVALGAGCSDSSGGAPTSVAVDPSAEARTEDSTPSGTAATETPATEISTTFGEVEVGGGAITFVEMTSEATAPDWDGAVVFLHGAAFTSQTWVDNGILARVAASGRRAVAIDLPGSGSSDRIDLANDEFLVELFGALELDPASTVIVSPSMSGAFSLAALRHPFFADLGGYVPVAPVGSSTFADGGTVEVPALVIWGDGDGADPRAAADRLAAGFTHAEVLVLANAGHAAYQQQPDAFTVALLTFVGGLDN